MYDWQHDKLYGACMTELLLVLPKTLLASHYPEQLKDSGLREQSVSYRILCMWPSDKHSWLENI